MTQYPAHYYGAPPPAPPPPSPTRKNWIGTTALVAAVVGLVLCWSVAGGVVLGVVAIVTGVVARGRVARAEADNGVVATCGVALGVLAIVVSLALIPVWLRVYREADVPAYLDCVAGTSNQDGARQCVDDLQKRIDELFGGEPAPSG